jgi:diguanylate cyclase (GGDEF)-like protein/PAS domain S-box-containing protein/putative nucleotidyltransferase with HDIG domain
LLIFAFISITGIIFTNWHASAEETSIRLTEDLIAEIDGEIDRFFSIPASNNAINKELIENGVINLSNIAEREKFFVSVLKNQNKEIYSFSYGGEKGEYYGARRNSEGVIEIMRNDASTGGQSWYYSVNEAMTAGELVLQAGQFDPRTRDWYKAAKEKHAPVFSPIYKHFVMNDLTVSAALPIYNKANELQGVLGTHIILSNIDEYLNDIVKSRHAYAVIVESDSGEFIANTFSLDNFLVSEDGKLNRNSLAEANIPAVSTAFEQYKLSGQDRFKMDYETDKLIIALTRYQKDGIDWVIITAIPESLYMAGIEKNIRLSIGLTILAALIATGIYMALTNKYLKLFDRLIEVTEKLAQGDLTQRVEVVRDDELGKISVSFNKMADTIFSLVNQLEEKVKERTIELEGVNNQLKENQERLQLLFNSTAEGIYGIDLNGNCTFCNASGLTMLGYSHQDELLGKNMHALIHHSFEDGSAIPVEQCKISNAILDGKGMHDEDEVFWRADGTSFNVAYHSYPQYKNGVIIGAVVTFMDITDRKKTTEQINYLSSHDPLTGLFNRLYFNNAIKKIDTITNLPISIIYGDVNGLKLANDIFGHAAGDELLQKVAQILKNACRNEDIVARIGGDEFIILLPSTEEKNAQAIIHRIQDEMSKELIKAIKCSVALGSATKTSVQQNIVEVMKNAETEMYKWKTIDRKKNNSDMLETIISTLHQKSPKEKQHSLSVSKLCEKFGHELHMTITEVNKLKEIGYFHDIGKIILDDSLLNRKEKLSDEEKREMQQHPVVGYRIINLFDDKLDLAEGIYGHHEKWDGSGYPKGLKGEEIPRLARIMAVVEYYESIRTYRKKTNVQDALLEIKQLSGIKFDPEIVEKFVTMMQADLDN